MAMYCECPLCGASLDPGERCDCADQSERHEKTTLPETARVVTDLSHLRTAN